MSPQDPSETEQRPPEPLGVRLGAAFSRAVSPANGTVLTIGNFDGLHAGHQAIISDITAIAARRGVSTTALTFEPHPVRYFRPEAELFRLTTPAQKTMLLRHYGVENPVVLRFDAELAGIEAEAFVSDVLIGAFKPSFVVVGYDFNFGRQRRGTPELLRDICEAAGIDVLIQEAVDVGEAVVSSTRVRQAIRAGGLDEARQMLGRPYAVLGRVVHGEGRGRVLGFPTANLLPEEVVLPPNGVYASYLEVAGETGRVFRSITNIGVRPTFDEGSRTIETFVLDEDDVDLDLYGEPCALHLTAFLREERRFPSPRELVAQIHEDIARCTALQAADAGADLVPQAAAAAYLTVEGSFGERGERPEAEPA